MDRATLTALIRSTSVVQLPAPAKTAPNQNRAEVSRVIFGQPTPVAGTFGASASSLSTGAFTGPAVASLAPAASTMDINTLVAIAHDGEL